MRAPRSSSTGTISLTRRRTSCGSRKTKRGWAILTKDKRIRRNKLEKQTIEEVGAAAFILTAGDVSGADMARAFVAALPKILRILDKYTRPIIATVGPEGGIAIFVGERRGGRKK